MLLPGFPLWVAYGIASDDLALVIPNAVAALVSAAAAALDRAALVGQDQRAAGDRRRPRILRAEEIPAAGPADGFDVPS